MESPFSTSVHNWHIEKTVSVSLKACVRNIKYSSTGEQFQRIGQGVHTRNGVGGAVKASGQ